jgi:hypothetical protein
MSNQIERGEPLDDIAEAIKGIIQLGSEDYAWEYSVSAPGR